MMAAFMLACLRFGAACASCVVRGWGSQLVRLDQHKLWLVLMVVRAGASPSLG